MKVLFENAVLFLLLYCLCTVIVYFKIEDCCLANGFVHLFKRQNRCLNGNVLACCSIVDARNPALCANSSALSLAACIAFRNLQCLLDLHILLL